MFSDHGQATRLALLELVLRLDLRVRVSRRGLLEACAGGVTRAALRRSTNVEVVPRVANERVERAGRDDRRRRTASRPSAGRRCRARAAARLARRRLQCERRADVQGSGPSRTVRRRTRRRAELRGHVVRAVLSTRCRAPSSCSASMPVTRDLPRRPAVAASERTCETASTPGAFASAERGLARQRPLVGRR